MGCLTGDAGADASPRPPPDREAGPAGAAAAPALDLVARSVARELRQPLTVIIGYAEILAGRLGDRPPPGEDEPDWAIPLERLRRAAWGMAASLEKIERAPELARLPFGSRGE